MFAIEFTSSAKEDVRQLSKNIRNSLRKRLEEVVSVNPLNCSEELSGPLRGFRSHHFEEYRVVYKVYEDLKKVAVVGVGKKNADHYAEIYKHLEGLAAAGKLADSILTGFRTVTSN